MQDRAAAAKVPKPTKPAKPPRSANPYAQWAAEVGEAASAEAYVLARQTMPARMLTGAPTVAPVRGVPGLTLADLTSDFPDEESKVIALDHAAFLIGADL